MGASSEQHLSQCLRYLFRGIIRFCVRRSIKLQEISEIIKALYVEVSIDELRARGESASTSRVSIMTGIHRRDVDRLKSGGDKELELHSNILTRVVGKWKNHPRYCTRPGKAKKLNLSGGAGRFADLVQSESKELNPYTVLLELERLNLVRRSGETVELIGDEFAVTEDFEAALALLGSDYEDLLKAVENNVDNRAEGQNLHLTTRYDNIPPEHMPVIKEWFMEEGAKLHVRARNFLARYDRDLNPKLRKSSGRGRVAFGTFSLTEDLEQRRK